MSSDRFAALRARMDQRASRVPEDTGGDGDERTAVDEREGTGSAGKSPAPERSYGLFKVNDPAVICCGFVGTAGAFCTRVDCSIVAHGKQKAEIDPDRIYICKGGRVCFLFPVLEVSRLSREQEETLLTEARTLEDWKQRFQALSVMDIDEDRGMEDVKEGISRVREAKTPRRIRGVGITNALLEMDALKDSAPVSKFEELLARAPPSSPTSGSVLVDDESAKFENLVGALKEELAGVWKFQTELLGYIRGLGPKLEIDMEELGEVVQEAQLQAQALEMDIGPTPRVLPAWADFPTLWGVTSALVEQAQSFMVERLPRMEEMREDFAALSNELDNAKGVAEKLEDNTFSLFEGLSEESAELGARIEALERRNPSSAAGFPTGGAGTIPELFARVETLERGSEHAEISLGRFSFNDEAELLHFMNAHQISKAGHFPDIYMAMAERVAYKSGQLNMKRVGEMKKGGMAGVYDLADVVAVDSFAQLLPSYLQPPNQTPNLDKTCLSGMPSIKEWRRTETGIKATMKRDVISFQASYSKQARKLAAGSVAQQLAELCISRTVQFWNCLIDWIDETYMEYVEHKFGETDAWLLVTQIMRRIFLDMKEHREGVTGSFGGDGAVVAMLWGILKTLSVMDRYTKAQIRNDPSVASEMITFLVTHPRTNGQDKLTAKITELETLVKEWKKKASDAGTKADTASTKITNMSKELGLLDRRLKKLE